MYENASKSNAIKYNSRIEDHDRDRDFRRAREQYRKGRSTVEQYISDILDIFRFEPKRKYVEELVDTVISDSTDVGGFSTIFSERHVRRLVRFD